ncbi:hypothetical protein SCLCIDRAFT_1218187 [Scleroderma citrinum Foug A]|uniref:Uncharacterized protein n=1 Tax=Scleroderma citrinum Foug A TaxID=1036808 RepID=A0A0C2ZAE8_9AGAM|nr:hypothetical protein SCLCIDRAFT_1218187 [Scleroderma citrinum Foug A]
MDQSDSPADIQTSPSRKAPYMAPALSLSADSVNSFALYILDPKFPWKSRNNSLCSAVTDQRGGGFRGLGICRNRT